VPTCAEGGVFGVLPGVIGVLQGIEVLKLLLGLGEPLIGRLVMFDALGLRFRELRLKKDPACPMCGEKRTIHELIDYESFCGLAPAAHADEDAESWEIDARELEASRARGEDVVIVDVREPHERRIARIDGALAIPLGELPARAGELDPARPIVLYCHHGVRSLRALEFLRQSGFRRLKSLRGGIEAWSREVDPAVPRY